MKVFLVEDSAPIRERLFEMIDGFHGHSVIGEAETYDDAVSRILATRPDVAIFDITLARGNGIDALAEVRKSMPDLAGIVLSNHATPQHRKASADAGARYFLDKSADFESITDILDQLDGREDGARNN